MNVQTIYSPWIELTVSLTAGAVLVVGLAAVLGRLVRSAVWRRALWQSAAVALWVVLLAEMSGLSHGLGRFVRTGLTAWRASRMKVTAGPTCRAGDGPVGPSRVWNSTATGLVPPVGKGGQAPRAIPVACSARHKALRGQSPFANSPGLVPQPDVTKDLQDNQDIIVARGDVAAWQREAPAEGPASLPSMPIGVVDSDGLSSMWGDDAVLQSDPQSPVVASDRFARGRSGSASLPKDQTSGDKPSGLAARGIALWPAGVWGFGCLVVLSFLVAGRVSLFWFACRIQALDDDGLRRRIVRLAQRIGLRTKVRLMESRQVATPVAFGTFSSTLVLPPGFTDDFDAAEQDAMLAHELAHLAARDSAWRLLAGLLCAVLWWHPAVWLLRRQLRIASEAAADEASLLVPDGPRRLADCLVEMGRRLAKPRPAVWLQVTGGGYRSDLGKRVVRLLGLENAAWAAPRRWRTRFAKYGIVLLWLVAVVCCTAWARPQAALREGETTMTLFKSGWSRSLASVALVTLWGSVSGDAAAGPPHSGPSLTDSDMMVALLAEDEEEEEHEARREREKREEGEARREREEREEREVRREREREEREERERGERQREEREREAREREQHEREAAEREQREREEREREEHEKEAMERERAVDNMLRERAEMIDRAHELERRLAELSGDADREAAEIQAQLRELEAGVHRIDREVRELKGEPPRREGPPPPHAPREELERRLHHIQVAVENLHAAGMHDAAEPLMREAEQLAHELGEGEHHPPREHRPERPGPPELRAGPPHPEQFEQVIREMHEQMDQMRREMAEMQQAIRVLVERQHHEGR